MSAKTVDALIKRVRTTIKGMDERDVINKLMKVGFSSSFATKLAADRYSAETFRDSTRIKFVKFLSLIA